jgi:hypothetical protein
VTGDEQNRNICLTKRTHDRMFFERTHKKHCGNKQKDTKEAEWRQKDTCQNIWHHIRTSETQQIETIETLHRKSKHNRNMIETRMRKENHANGAEFKLTFSPCAIIIFFRELFSNGKFETQSNHDQNIWKLAKSKQSETNRIIAETFIK